MDFQQAIGRLQDTLLVMAEIQRHQTEVRHVQTDGMALHEKRMKHIDMRLAEITKKIEGLEGLDLRREKQN